MKSSHIVYGSFFLSLFLNVVDATATPPSPAPLSPAEREAMLKMRQGMLNKSSNTNRSSNTIRERIQQGTQRQPGALAQGNPRANPARQAALARRNVQNWTNGLIIRAGMGNLSPFQNSSNHLNPGFSSSPFGNHLNPILPFSQPSPADNVINAMMMNQSLQSQINALKTERDQQRKHNNNSKKKRDLIEKLRL